MAENSPMPPPPDAIASAKEEHEAIQAPPAEAETLPPLNLPGILGGEASLTWFSDYFCKSPINTPSGEYVW